LGYPVYLFATFLNLKTDKRRTSGDWSNKRKMKRLYNDGIESVLLPRRAAFLISDFGSLGCTLILDIRPYTSTTMSRHCDARHFDARHFDARLFEEERRLSRLLESLGSKGELRVEIGSSHLPDRPVTVSSATQTIPSVEENESHWENILRDQVQADLLHALQEKEEQLQRWHDVSNAVSVQLNSLERKLAAQGVNVAIYLNEISAIRSLISNVHMHPCPSKSSNVVTSPNAKRSPNKNFRNNSSKS
jgi:hypothetical protein